MESTSFRLGVDIEVHSDDEEVVTQHVRVKKIENLEKCGHRLKKLAIVASGVAEIEGLDQNLGLQHLEIYQGLVTQIRNVSHLHNLVVLDLSFNRIETIGDSLRNLVNLEKLYLSSNKITEIEGLANLTKLKVLELGANKITHIRPGSLANQSELRELWLGKNRIENMHELAVFHFPNLEQLSLQANRLTHWSADLFKIATPNLAHLFLGNNGLSDPDQDVLQALNPNTLEDLDISYNRLTRVPDFSANPLHSLEELWLNHNQIKSTDSFGTLKSGCPILKTIYLEGNPAQTECPLDYRTALMRSIPGTVEKIDATMVPQKELKVITSDHVTPLLHKTILKH